MSKGNIIMGYGRGKVGSIVLARSKGQQIARAYNEHPKNPRSELQMLQRSIFASAVKFFVQGRQAFFQFAFENKPTKRSDYNMFVSANAKVGQHISKNAYDEQTYPVLAPFKMTSGSLAEIDVKWDNEGTMFVTEFPHQTGDDNWGKVCRGLISKYGFSNGDILTVTAISAEGSTSENTPAVEPSRRGRVVWDIKQAVINVDSTEDVSDLFGSAVSVGVDSLEFDYPLASTNAVGLNVTVSRITVDGLKVSDSFLVLNKVAQDIQASAEMAGYIGNVLSSWKSAGKAILEGSLVE